MNKTSNKKQYRQKRKASSFFNAEKEEVVLGIHSVIAALSSSSERLKRICLTAHALEKISSQIPSFIEKKDELPLEVVSPAFLTQELGEDFVHQGAVAILRKKTEVSLDEILAQVENNEEGFTLVLLDQVTDPHNVGAILRSCAAFSVKALLTTERHSPKESLIVSKSACGGAEFVPNVKVVNLSRAIEEIKRENFWVIGLESKASKPLEEVVSLIKKKDPHPKLALVLGAEGKGLRELTIKKCDFLCSLSLPGKIKSLNVSNAAALALYVLSE